MEKGAGGKRIDYRNVHHHKVITVTRVIIMIKVIWIYIKPRSVQITQCDQCDQFWKKYHIDFSNESA